VPCRLRTVAPRSFAFAAKALSAIALALVASAALASDVRAEAAPERYVALASVGAPLRLTRDVDLDQSAFAPIYTDVVGGYVLSGEHVRHGVGLGLSLNLTKDGGFTEPVGPAEQFALAPEYLLYVDLGSDALLLGQAGLPIVLTGSTTVGLALSAALGYRLLAGMGMFAELGFETFVGVSSRLHPSVSLELGLFLDYEVLP
jgi:hypothetical protein